MISRGPDIFPSRTYDAALHERTRRCDLDDDLRGARNDRKPRPDESSEQDFSNHVFSILRLLEGENSSSVSPVGIIVP
jgi:hypothetical protein